MSSISKNFDVEIAKDLDINSAIIYSNIEFWVFKNEANKKHFYDGKHWTYNSIEAFSKMFEWLSVSQIRRCLDRLESEGYVLSGNYNQSSYDRTKWYCLNRKLHLTNMTNGNDENDKPIPYTKPYIKPDKENKALSLFSESIYSDYDKLRNELKDDLEFVKKFKGVDLKNYIFQVDAWSESVQKKRTERGWLMTLKKWMKDDLKDNKLIKLPDNPNKPQGHINY